MLLKQFFLFCSILFLQYCGQDNNTRTYRLPKSEVPQQIQTKKNLFLDFIWEKPLGWIPTSGSSMRLASFNIPYTGGIGDLSVIRLAGTGGGIEPNINRWRRQLNLEPKSLIEIENDLFKKEGRLGEYKMIKIINIQNDSAFLAAIIPVENQTLFVKLVADPSGIQTIESDFIAFCSSIYFSH